MERPIGLDDQLVSQADKVEHVRAHRDLPPELQVAEPSVAQQPPQELLG
jgi:hypothetical protein